MEKSMLENGIVFNFENSTGLVDPKMFRKLPSLDGAHTWLQSMFYAKSKLDYLTKTYDIEKSIDEKSIVILPDSIISDRMDATHQGLMQYVYHAWAKELGVVLKPDILFYTVISEIKNQIMKTPDKYQNLFTGSSKKENIIVFDLTIGELMSVLGDIVPCKELFNLVTKTNFSTEPLYFKQVMGITMADMATSYYCYTTTMCGIPKVIVLGSEYDWMNLTNVVLDLKNIFNHCKILSKYLSEVFETLNNLVSAAFVTNNNKFFENMFIYYKNPVCASGHAPVIIDGFIKNFYIGYYDNDNFTGHSQTINRFPSHLNCLPYDNKDDPNNIKYYFYACGLSSSRIIDGYLCPEYNIAHCELIHPEKKLIFDVLASNN